KDGRFSRHFRQTFSKSRGTPERRREGGIGSRSRTWATVSIGVGALNGGCPGSKPCRVGPTLERAGAGAPPPPPGRRHGGAEAGGGGGEAEVVAQAVGEPEVGDVRLTLGIEEDVRGLHVAVEEAPAVRDVYGAGDRDEQPHRGGEVASQARHLSGEAPAFDK